MTTTRPRRFPVRPAPGRRGRRRWVLPVVGVVLAVLLVPPAVSVGRAIAVPGTDTTSARLAEWARDHGFDGVITWLETKTYHAPKVGGLPPTTSPLRTAPGGPVAARAGTALPPPIAPIAAPALPGEGSWHVLASVHGAPALAVAYLRPDAMHTSYVSGVVWINPRLVRAQLHPGSLDPGGSGWAQPSRLPADRRAGLLAAFNSGFRLRSAHGGFYEGGRYGAPLRAGIASMVFRRDGTLTVAKWGRDAHLGPDVAAVRQNLALLIDGGRVAAGLDANAGNAWGATLGNAKYVWRSGIGVRVDGGVIYVAGNRLTAGSLGELLRRAGCLRAMELDINPEWTSFIRYTPTERNLLPDMQGSPRRYDTTSSRDFVALYAR